jgi:hypothetical protein
VLLAVVFFVDVACLVPVVDEMFVPDCGWLVEPELAPAASIGGPCRARPLAAGCGAVPEVIVCALAIAAVAAMAIVSAETWIERLVM